MTDRKKLMEMICDAVQTDRCVGKCNHPHCNTVQMLCDHLISNGVEITVKCKDCMNWKRMDRSCGWCEAWEQSRLDVGYCHCGERKDHEKN